MSAIVPSTRGGTCGICLEEFGQNDPQLTHEGGKHDPFHEPCLQEWLRHNPTCPVDRTPIDSSSLLSRVEVIRDLELRFSRVIIRHAMIIAFNVASEAAKASAMRRAAIGGIGGGWSMVTVAQTVEKPALLARLVVRGVGGYLKAGCLTGGFSVGSGLIARIMLAQLGRDIALPGEVLIQATSVAGAMAFAGVVTAQGTKKEAVFASIYAIIEGGGAIIKTARTRRKIYGVGVGFFVGGIASLMAAVSFKEKNAARFATFGLPLISGATAGIFSLLSTRITAITNTL